MPMRIPVVSMDGAPLMPSTLAKVRKLLRGGVATGRYNKLGMFYIQMRTPVGIVTQPLKMTVDYGSKYDGYAVGGKKEVCMKGMAKMPERVAKKLDERRRLRRVRRYRLWRRKKRFDNRKRQEGWIAPSQNAKVEFRHKIVTELARMYPITIENGVEAIAFNHYTKRWGKHFSTAEIGKTRFYRTLVQIAPLVKFKGWQTARLRKQYAIAKTSKKNAVTPESHANDAVAMLCGLFGSLPAHNDAVFWYWQRPELARRPLHRQHHQKGHIRPRFGGTTNGGYLRKGDYVEAEKAGKKYRGWVCGLPTQKTKLIGVMDVFGKRMGQFAISKVSLLCRNTGIMWMMSTANSSPSFRKGTPSPN